MKSIFAKIFLFFIAMGFILLTSCGSVKINKDCGCGSWANKSEITVKNNG